MNFWGGSVSFFYDTQVHREIGTIGRYRGNRYSEIGRYRYLLGTLVHTFLLYIVKR